MASMHVLEQSPTSVDLDTDSVQNVRYSRPRLGCGAIVGGFTIVSTLLFALFAYPHYHTSRAWLFWTVTGGVLLAEAFVIYLAVFVSHAIDQGARKQ